MFDKIWDSLKDDVALGHFATVVHATESLISYFQISYMKDEDARDAAIDALCQFLQSQKTVKVG